MSLLPREWQSLSPRNRKRALARLRFLRFTQLAPRANFLPIAYLAATAALAIAIYALLPPHPLAPVLAVGLAAILSMFIHYLRYFKIAITQTVSKSAV